MNYLLCRANTWHFSRRVPKPVREYDAREYVRFSLKTDSKKEAIRLAVIENVKLEKYWADLIETGQKHGHSSYKQIVDRARLLGFTYKPLREIAVDNDYNELFRRLLYLESQQLKEKQVEAVLGVSEEPEIMLDEVLPVYLDLTKSVILEKSDRQYKKWKNPRQLAMGNVLTCLGNRPVNSLTRQDANEIKDWYLKRIEAKEITFGTADKHLVQIKSIITTVCDDRKISIDKAHVFDKFLFNIDDHKARPPFSTAHIVNVLLNPEKLAGMSEEYQALLMIFAETGVCVDEIIGVRPENIHIDHDIPHFFIKPHFKDKLKTKHRERVMPLAGYALDAFRKYPKGFANLVEDADTATSAIGKYLRENNMLETPEHSAYSLRHSFQDRLTNLDCPDRIQTDLMGHAFKDRVKYGLGATLEHACIWMKKIQLKLD